MKRLRQLRQHKHAARWEKEPKTAVVGKEPEGSGEEEAVEEI